MDNLICTLCNSLLQNAEFDLQKSFTLYSKSSLLILLQSCVKEELSVTNYLICKLCYLLLNELDNIKLRSKAIEDQLRVYVTKYLTSTNCPVKVESTHEDANKNEECTVCYKKVNSKNFKAHLKIQHPEINDLEQNFDFDEVSSMPDLDPLLEDINELNDVRNDGKHLLKLEKCEIEKYSKNNTTLKKRNNAKSFECSECSKTWKSLAELKNHMLSHSKDRPYICEICGQAYKRQQALTVHVGMHNGVNPFTCVYCNKSFTQKGGLARHMPIHTGELPFQCDLCGKRFVHHTSFNMHKLSHTGEKSYKCENCGLLLMSGSHLKRHMRVHTGEKKYACFVCGKKFAERYNLVVHEKLHSGQTRKKKHKCKLCDSMFSCQANLEEHLLNDHQKLQNTVDPLLI